MFDKIQLDESSRLASANTVSIIIIIIIIIVIVIIFFIIIIDEKIEKLCCV